MKVSNFYLVNSNPLQQVLVEDLLLNHRYCTDEGHMVKVVNIEAAKDIIDMEVVQRTELVDGELITGLDSKLLKLFWTLMKNNAGRVRVYEDDSD